MLWLVLGAIAWVTWVIHQSHRSGGHGTNFLTANSRIQNCTYRKIITYQTPQSLCLVLLDVVMNQELGQAPLPWYPNAMNMMTSCTITNFWKVGGVVLSGVTLSGVNIDWLSQRDIWWTVLRKNIVFLFCYLNGYSIVFYLCRMVDVISAVWNVYGGTY